MEWSKKPQHVYSESEETARNYLQLLQKEGVSFYGKKVLDIGCGTGMYSNLIVELGAERVLGIDIEPQNIIFAAHLYRSERVQFKCISLLEMVTSERFDLVFARGVIYYFNDIDMFFASVRDVLEPSGEMLVSFIENSWVTQLSNIVKHASCATPLSMHPFLVNVLVCMYYIFNASISENRMSIGVIKSKMSTIFFPVFHLFDKEGALEVSKKNHFSVLKYFPRVMGTDFTLQLMKN